MSWKKMIFGEKMPDKEDPRYRPGGETRQGGRGRATLRLQAPQVVSRHCVRHCADLFGT